MALRDAVRNGEDAARAADQVLGAMRCSVCDRRRGRIHGADAAPRNRAFNDRVLVDTLRLCRVRGKP